MEIFPEMGWALAIYVMAFSLLEKVNKQKYVVATTNAKTKKLTLQLINQIPNPIALVNKKGQILFFNQQFEFMLMQRLGIKSLPNSIFKLINEEEISGTKLKNLVDESFVGSAQSKVEIRLLRQTRQLLHPNNSLGATHSGKAEDMNGTRSTIDRNLLQHKDVFVKYEMAEVKADQVMFNSQKAAMLTFNIVSEQRAKNQLLYLDSQVLIKFLTNINKKMQRDLEQQKNDEKWKQEIVEFMGASFYVINKIQQIQHEMISDTKDTSARQKEDFFIRDEIMQIVESLSVKCLNPEATFRLDARSCLPEKLSGDTQNFRLSIQSIVEFVLKYTKEGQIDFVVKFDGFVGEQADKKLNISFDMTFNKNQQFNEEPLIRLLNAFQRNRAQTLEEVLLHNYDDFFELIYHFGFGILMFPGLVNSLGGSFNISSFEPSPNSGMMGRGTLGQSLFSISRPSNNLGDSETGFVQAASGVSNVNNEVKSTRRIKVTFLITFDQAELSRKIVTPFIPFNPYKEETGGKQVYKSPLVKASKYQPGLTLYRANDEETGR